MKKHLVIRRRGLPFFVHKDEGRELPCWVQIGDGGRWGMLTTINRGDGFHVELRRYVKVTHTKPPCSAMKNPPTKVLIAGPTLTFLSLTRVGTGGKSNAGVCKIRQHITCH